MLCAGASAILGCQHLHTPGKPAGQVSAPPNADKVLHSQGRPGCPGRVGVLPVLHVECLPVLVVILVRPYEVLLVLRVHPAVGVVVACAQGASLRLRLVQA